MSDIDANTPEGMLREAHDLLRFGVERWKNSNIAWVADDLCIRIDAAFPGAVNVIEGADR